MCETNEAYRTFYQRLSISLNHIFQTMVNDYNISYQEYEEISNLFHDHKTHDVILCSSDRNDDYVQKNYKPEFVELSRRVFKKQVYDVLELNDLNCENIEVFYTCSADREFVSVTHLYCVVSVSFLTKESLNKFKLTNTKVYRQLVDFEKEMERYRVVREERIKTYAAKGL